MFAGCCRNCSWWALWVRSHVWQTYITLTRQKHAFNWRCEIYRYRPVAVTNNDEFYKSGLFYVFVEIHWMNYIIIFFLISEYQFKAIVECIIEFFFCNTNIYKYRVLRLRPVNAGSKLFVETLLLFFHLFVFHDWLKNTNNIIRKLFFFLLNSKIFGKLLASKANEMSVP